MTYTHSTNHSFKPKTEFWRAFENLFKSFPFWEGDELLYESYRSIVTFYEKKSFERFEMKDRADIYGHGIVQVGAIGKRVNYLGKLIKFLSNSISNPDTMHGFQKFFESMYYYLLDIHNLNPKNELEKKKKSVYYH